LTPLHGNETSPTTRMKIAFIEPHLKVFGGIRRIIEMANRLSDRGHAVTIYHSDGTPCTWLECRAAIAPGRAVLDSTHDVVVYNDPEPEDMYLARHARSRVTFYYVLHLYRLELMAGFHPTIYLGRNKRTRRLRACLRSRHVKLANSSWIQRWLREHMGIDSLLMLGGVNFDLFHPVQLERAPGAPFQLLPGSDKLRRRKPRTHHAPGQTAATQWPDPDWLKGPAWPQSQARIRRSIPRLRPRACGSAGQVGCRLTRSPSHDSTMHRRRQNR